MAWLLGVALVPGPSYGAWNDDWPDRKELKLDPSKQGADLEAAVTEVPVLVRLHSGNFQSFFSLKDGAADLRFVAADGKTVLKHHVEKFDPVNEMALIWVKAPRLAPDEPETVSMYYGNEAAAGADDPAGTYDADQVLVYHFDSVAANWKDATGFGNHPVAPAPVAASSAALVGAGASFAGQGGLSVPASESLQFVPDKGWTFSAWIKVDAPQADAYLLDANGGHQSLVIGIDGSSVYARAVVGGNRHDTARSQIAPGGWHHVALVVFNGKVSLYLDAAETASVEAPLTSASLALTLGASAGGSNPLTAEVDEVQVSRVARNADWLRFAVRSQGADGRVVTYGDEASEGGSTSYFGTILRSVTVDGWVVIFLLAIMAAISWAVMVGKAVLLTRVRKDNQAFLHRFKRINATTADALDQDDEANEDPELRDSALLSALFGKHDHFQSATLYQLYHTGIHDIKERTGRSVGAQQRGLSEHALTGVRAVLDASYVRELQKLNEHMVLLTIAISGGPFLGLLGTVVGVMITFAAIAATGDVNINAIAPGIAAALVATVAGLIVAIPALFGYNYLSAQIRDINADMRAFCDEFMSRIAEQYSN
ncbi:MAG: DUF2341 domain-containing protein [Nevskiales bacterium]|nr:DUF2341 domain-containing protein [Nevskiales bacterium]